jgi:uncharacterized protein (TIGR02145 family)
MRIFFIFILVGICGLKAQTVTIGNQIWSTKNLDVTTFRNGDPIREAKTNEEWKMAHENGIPAWCYYNNDPLSKEKYGLIYNGYVLVDSRGIVPDGWVIPTKVDWINLLKNTNTNYFEMQYVKGGIKSEDTDKFRSKTLWSDNKNGTNITGLSVYPSGGRNFTGDFTMNNSIARFWTSTIEKDGWHAFTMTFFNDGLNLEPGLFQDGSTIRCLKGNIGNQYRLTDEEIAEKNQSQGLTEKQIEEIDLSQDVISSDDAKTKENVRQFLYGPTTSSATNKTVENNNSKNEVNNTEIKYVNCDFQILKPKLNFTFIDNRTLCCYCKKRYSEYSKNSEFTLNYQEVSYLTEILYLHHQKIGASNEHIKSDLNRLTDFIADNYKGLSSMGLLMAPSILYTTQIPLFITFGQEIGSKNRKVDLYHVEKFCSAECADNCSRSYNCSCR